MMKILVIYYLLRVINMIIINDLLRVINILLNIFKVDSCYGRRSTVVINYAN